MAAAVVPVFPNVVGMTLQDFYDSVVMTGRPEVTIAWLRQQGLLATDVDCPRCGQPMRDRPLRSVMEGRCWRCRNDACRKYVNLRYGSFFEKSHLSLEAIITVTFMWAIELTEWQIESQARIGHEAAVQWLQCLRDECSWDLVQAPRPIGGVGHIVAIDESLLARRKVGNRQGRPVPQQWVFGGVDLQTKNFFMELVPQRDQATLFPVLQRNILPGTMIWSDGWAAYNNIPTLGYQHQVVNHQQHFVDPVTGVHTNDSESRWNACKQTLKRKFGVRRAHLDHYLDEYMWRSRRARPQIFSDILDVIRRHYPV